MLLIGGGALLSLAMEASRLRVGWMNRLFMLLFAPILKQSEVSEISGATWFLIAVFFTFYFYGPEVALPVLLFVAVGDPAAALVGTRFPGPRFWGKSPSGGVAFGGRCAGGMGSGLRPGFRRVVGGSRHRSGRSRPGGIVPHTRGRQPHRAPDSRRRDDPGNRSRPISRRRIPALPRAAAGNSSMPAGTSPDGTTTPLPALASRYPPAGQSPTSP